MQLAHLQAWLLRTNGTHVFRFVVSPVPWSVSSGKGAGGVASGSDTDGWSSYLNERNALLDFLSAHRVRGVVLLSADLHYAVVVRLRKGVYEFSASPMQQLPFPAHTVPTVGEDILFQAGWGWYFGVVETCAHACTRPEHACTRPAGADADDVDRSFRARGEHGDSWVRVSIWHYNYVWGRPSAVYQLRLNLEDL